MQGKKFLRSLMNHSKKSYCCSLDMKMLTNKMSSDMITETNQILIFLLVLVRIAVASLVIYNLIDILFAKKTSSFH